MTILLQSTKNPWLVVSNIYPLRSAPRSLLPAPKLYKNLMVSTTTWSFLYLSAILPFSTAPVFPRLASIWIYPSVFLFLCGTPTSTMPLKADQIKALFPNPILNPIVGKPTHEGIRLLKKETNKNLSAIPSNLGCGTKGLLWIGTSPTVYATISSVPFFPPTNPGSAPSAAAIAACGSAKDIASVSRHPWSRS